MSLLRSLQMRGCTFAAVLALAACATPIPPSSPPESPAAAAALAEPPAAAVAAVIAVPAASAVVPAASAAVSAPAVDERVVVVPVDPLRPEVQVDLADQTTRIDLWARVRRGFAVPDLDTDLVRDRERWYTTRPDYVQRMTERGGRYLFHIVEEVERRGMPTELALLPFIESAFNPQAMSSA